MTLTTIIVLAIATTILAFILSRKYDDHHGRPSSRYFVWTSSVTLLSVALLAYFILTLISYEKNHFSIELKNVPPHFLHPLQSHISPTSSWSTAWDRI